MRAALVRHLDPSDMITTAVASSEDMVWPCCGVGWGLASCQLPMLLPCRRRLVRLSGVEQRLRGWIEVDSGKIEPTKVIWIGRCPCQAVHRLG